MTALAEILLHSKQKFFNNVIKQELDHFPISPKLIQEIDDVYTLDFLEPSFSDLEKIKKPTPYMIVEMMEEWMAVSNLDEYLYNNYPKDWSAIQEIIFFNLRDELLNAHYSFHHQSRLEHDYGLNEMAFYF
jgi:tRNA splicing ligase